MARRGIQFIRCNYYHLYNRGCNKEKLFLCEENYLYLLRLLRSATSHFHVSVIAYCLMPNHYHLLVRQDGDILLDKMMQDVFNRYTKVYNKRYQRSGTLFEGPFKAKYVGREAYLLHLCRYIHRNPVDAGLVALPEQWKYSNYLDWIGRRDGNLVDREFILEYFDLPEEYITFMHDYIPLTKEEKELSKYLFD
jgi:putative transposase